MRLLEAFWVEFVERVDACGRGVAGYEEHRQGTARSGHAKVHVSVVHVKWSAGPCSLCRVLRRDGTV